MTGPGQRRIGAGAFRHAAAEVFTPHSGKFPQACERCLDQRLLRSTGVIADITPTVERREARKPLRL